MFKRTFLILSGLIIFPVLVSAYVSPGKPTGFTNDFAGALKTETKVQLEEKLSNFSQETGNEVSVAIISSLGDETIETYAVKLFEEWGIGKAKEDNGVLLLVSIEDKELRIEVGYGLEPIITDLEASRIIREAIVPEFKNGNYDLGITKGVDRIISDITNGYVPSEPSRQMPNINSFFYPAIFLIIIFASVLGRSKSWWAGGVIGGVIGIFVSIFLGFVFTGLISLAVLIPLGLLFDFLVSRSYQKHKNLGSTPWWFGGGGHGGGGFGGFGGGISGGGGASGRW